MVEFHLFCDQKRYDDFFHEKSFFLYPIPLDLIIEFNNRFSFRKELWKLV